MKNKKRIAKRTHTKLEQIVPSKHITHRYLEYVKNFEVELPKIGEKHLGSHSVMIYTHSKKDRCFKFLNSWGMEWGDKGRGSLPFDYFEHELIVEAWSMVMPYELTKELPKKTFNLKNKNGEHLKVESIGYPSLREEKNYLQSFNVYGDSNIQIGHAHVSPSTKDVLEIEELYLLPLYQNKGFGTTIMKFIEKSARINKFSKIIGWIGAQDLINEHDKKVVNFFQKNGFTLKEDSSKFRDAVYKFEKNLI